MWKSENKAKMRFISYCLVVVCVVAAVLWKPVAAYPDCTDCGICQQRYLPVCGADGITYHNACHLGCEKTCRKPGLKIVHDGECGTNQLIYKYH